MKNKIINTVLLVILICAECTGNLFAQKLSSKKDTIPVPTYYSDSCGKSYSIQMETLINEYFKRDIIKELLEKKKGLYIALIPTIQDTFSINVKLRRGDSTLFTKDELSGLEKYIKQKGKFKYCFLIDGCGGIIEEGKEYPIETEQEIKTRWKKLYGQHIQWSIVIPHRFERKRFDKIK